MKFMSFYKTNVLLGRKVSDLQEMNNVKVNIFSYSSNMKIPLFNYIQSELGFNWTTKILESEILFSL